MTPREYRTSPKAALAVGRWLTISLCLIATLGVGQAAGATDKVAAKTLLIGIGDSLTQGTMDATDNGTNTLSAYLQKVYESLAQKLPLVFGQPLLSDQGQRLTPFAVPTNLGVDGADIFSVEGIQYYKRVGASQSYVSSDLLADKALPALFKDMYDRALYPINLLAKKPVAQLDAASWLLNQGATAARLSRALVILWMGNNDASLAALGSGGKNPAFLPIPVDQIQPEMPLLALLMKIGEQKGLLSFSPYSLASIERNLTDLQDFVTQYDHVLTRLLTGGAASGIQMDVFVLTLPYYSAVGYLFDSEDLEFYLQKVNPAYTVPPTFQRVAAPGQPITDPFKGDRVSLLTFGLMYALLTSGYSVDYVNQVLEVEGQQRDGLVLSETEQQYIMSRIDGFNESIKQAAANGGPHVHLIDVGQYMNDALSGKVPVMIGDRVLTRKWVRGSSFTLDGVHPSYTGQALVANFLLKDLNEVLGVNAPLYDLSMILASDPYVDQDGDGWAPGPNYSASGITNLLFLFKDPNDANPAVQPVLPPDVWQQIGKALLGEILNLPPMREEAARIGLIPGN